MVRHTLIYCTAVLAAVSGCHTGASVAGTGRPLAADERAAAPPSGLVLSTALSRGVLAYQIALTRSRVASIELGVEFELVVRPLPTANGAPGFRHRLGSPDYDFTGLVIDDARQCAYVTGLDGTLRKIDLVGGLEIERWHLGQSVTAVELGAGGASILTGSADGVLCLRRARDGALLQCAVAHAGPVSAISSNGDLVASASWSGDLAAWNLADLRLLGRWRGGGSINDVAISPDGTHLAVATSSAPPTRSAEVAASEVSGKRTNIAPGATVAVLTAPDSGGQLVVQWRSRGHAGPVTSVVWLGDARVASSSWDRTVRLWSSSTGHALASLGGFSHLIADLDTDDEGRVLGVAAWAPGSDGPAAALVAPAYPEQPTGSL